MVHLKNRDFVQKAICFIELNLDKDISVLQIAEHVGFSEFHFRRIFCAATKETVSDYVRKRRLIEAARLLLQSDKSIADLAYQCHFESQEAFTRAFKKMFGITPGKVRKEFDFSSVLKKVDLSIPREVIAGIYSGERLMEPKIVELAEQKTVGLGGAFQPKSVGTINNLWNQFLPRTGEIKNSRKGIALGICCRKHPSIEKPDDGSIVYIAALPVENVEHIPAGMVETTLAAGKYAVFTHKGPLRNLPQTCDFIWGEWASSGKLKLRDAPDFELYDERFDSEKLDGEIDIYIPVED